jgi:hypothetical protein
MARFACLIALFAALRFSRLRRLANVGPNRARKRELDRPVSGVRVSHVGHRDLGLQANSIRGRLLRGWWRDHRSAKRLGHDRGLYFCGIVSRDLGPCLRQGVWRPDLFYRFCGWLADFRRLAQARAFIT